MHGLAEIRAMNGGRETVRAIMRDVEHNPFWKPRKVANNTVMYYRKNGDRVFRLHHTDVVVRHADGTYTLDSGGWQTLTTKDRINTYAPVVVFQKNYQWFLLGRKDDGSYDHSVTYPFVDGMRVDSRGVPISMGAVTDSVGTPIDYREE